MRVMLLALLLPTAALATPFVDLFNRAWDTGAKAASVLKHDNADLVKEPWTERETRCAILKVTLELVELAMRGTSAFRPAFEADELTQLRQFLLNQRSSDCRPPPGKDTNAGAEFIRAVEARTKTSNPTGWALGDLLRGAAALGVGLATPAEALPASVLPPLLLTPQQVERLAPKGVRATMGGM